MADTNGGYKAGDLEVSILGIATDVDKNITDVINSLGRLQKALNTLSTLKVGSIGTKLATAFSGIATSLKSIDDASIARLKSLGEALSPIANSISTLGSIGTAVSSISSFTEIVKRLEKIDFKKAKQQFQQLTEAIRPFLEEIKAAQPSLTAFEEIIKKLNIAGGKKSAKSAGNAFSFLSIAKWTSIFYLGRRLGRVVQSIVQSGADYTETLNLWEVSMGNNLSTATEFVNKMNEAYGISEKTLMNAQAIFKNMLGSLGQISDTMAYQLSEGITQMALDYASLYNVNFEKAFEKFQAALAGQVRPIRSVSGYDITENTLYQLYQSLGGEKSVRNLSRTEKQLLSILAIFNQMTASGAVGDLERTMDSFANQSRVFREEWQRVITYAGLLLVKFIETQGWLLKINASMIALGDILYAAASATGAITSYGDPFAAVTDGAESASEEIDKMNGKLLDFDKFRSLSSQADEDISIEQTLLDAISGYSTILDGVSNSAKEMAEAFKTASGFFDENGVFNVEKWEKLEEKIKLIGITLATVFGALTLTSIVKFLISPVNIATLAIGTLVASIIQLATSWDEMSKMERVGTILIAVASAAVALFVAFKALSLSVPAAIAAGLAVATGCIAAGGLLAETLNDKVFASYETGASNIDSGTVFRAGEHGKTEAVFTASNGKTNVANVQQMRSAFYLALMDYSKSNQGRNQPIKVSIDGREVFEVTTAQANKQGLSWSRV